MHKDKLKIPDHIAFIIDGNGRWATARGLPRGAGHKQGMEAVANIIKVLLKFNVKVASFFAFSTENWKRSKEEIDGIFNTVRTYIAQNRNYFVDEDIKVRTMGDLTPFPEDLKAQLEKVVKETQNGQKLIVNLALNYGGRADIARAATNLIAEGKKEVTEEDISNHLYSADLPDPDLVIRTSGESRLSNFMMYQCSYAELYFPKVLWPDFNEKHFVKALKVFSKRDRRFGGIK